MLKRFLFFRVGSRNSSLVILPMAWLLGCLKMLFQWIGTCPLRRSRSTYFIFISSCYPRGYFANQVRESVVSFEGWLTLDEGGLGRLSVLAAGILNATEELAVWEETY